MPEWTMMQRKIAELMLAHLKVEVPSPDTDLIESGILDSLSFVDLLYWLEQAFATRINLDDIEVDHFRSVARISDFIAARQSAR